MIILVLLFPESKHFRYEYIEGRPWLYEDLIAPIDFPIKKTQAEIEAEKLTIQQKSKLYFRYDQKATDQQMQYLSNIFDTIWIETYGFGDRKSYLANKEQCLSIGSKILETGLVNLPKNLAVGESDKLVYLINNKEAKSVFLNYFYNAKSAYLFTQEALSEAKGVHGELILNFLNDHLKPNVSLDSVKTRSEKESQMAQISPNKGIVLKGQHLISKGEIIDNETFKILESFKFDLERLSRKSNLGLYLGKIILISIPLLTLGLFLFFFRPEIMEDNKNLIMIFILIISMTIITRLVVEYESTYTLMIPLMISPIIIRAFYDSRLALIVHIITIILISFVVPDSFKFIFLQLITGLITIISVVKLQKRSQFFFTTLYIFISYSVIYVGIELITEAHLENIKWNTFIFFAVSAGFTLLSTPLIYLFERLFGMVTDVSLLEYADTNNPLLKELSNVAPGTFQHSIQVSNLAEAAADEIGANALLVRAGAMYHDIGKMDNPMYFTENQHGAYSPHDELSYEESANIIIGHVLAGVKKAKEKNLPDQIIDFIRTHHGTKRVEYFYRMHKRELPDQEIQVSKFTYHGPIPFSKETSVLMMADAVEAASRSLKNPDSKSINDLVDQIIKSQLDQGQFNNANISIREINISKNVFKKKLLNINHLRIEYPEDV
jgi:putative nucleotidyltransferase with HDIG domain